MEARYTNADDDPRGPWTSGDLTARNFYSEGVYPVTAKNGREISGPPQGRYWGVSKKNFDFLDGENRIWWGDDGGNMPRLKRFLSDVKAGKVPQTIWHHSEVGHTQDAKKELLRLFDFSENEDVFISPKPSALLARVMEIATKSNATILDSFAGSATTAHAVLEANKRDGGNRKFILVEMEDYADRLTGERMRRVINGYDFTGTQRTELMRENLNWSKLQRADRLTEQVQAIETLHGHEYDRITKQVKDGALIVTGEKAVADRTEGLGGCFTYCTLGPPLELEKILQGTDLPAWDALGRALFHMATNRPLDAAQMEAGTNYLGQADGQHLWLVYRPDLEWLNSPDAALTLSYARQVAKAKEGRHLVFAPARHVSQKMLDSEGVPVEFVPLPFALYRIERG